LTYRLLGVLLAQLPGESAYKTALRDAIPDDELADLVGKPENGHGPWSRLALLVADEIDELRHAAPRHCQGARRRVEGRLRAVPESRGDGDAPAPTQPARGVDHRAIAEEHARLHGYWVEPDAG
jgi:hypothetical protein